MRGVRRKRLEPLGTRVDVERARRRAEPRDQLLGDAHRRAQPLQIPVGVVAGDGRIGPGIPEGASEHAAHVVHVGKQRRGSCQDRSATRVEALPQRHVHRVERRGLLRRRPAGVGALDEETRSVQVKADSQPPRLRGDPAGLGRVEGLAVQPSHRRLDRDRPDWRGHAARGAALNGGRRFLPSERGLARRQRDESQLRELLGTVAGIVVEMADVLNENAAPRARERSNRQVVGERARRHEDRGLLAEQRRELLLQGLDRAAAGVLVGIDAVLREPCQQLGVRGGRELEAVAHEVDVEPTRASGRHLSRRDGSSRESGQADEPPPCPLRHGATSSFSPSTLTIRTVSGR